MFNVLAFGRKACSVLVEWLSQAKEIDLHKIKRERLMKL